MIYDARKGSSSGLPYDNFAYDEVFLVVAQSLDVTLKYPAYEEYGTVDGVNRDFKVYDETHGAYLSKGSGWEVLERDYGQVVGEICAHEMVPDNFYIENINNVIKKIRIKVGGIKVRITYQRPMIERIASPQDYDGTGPRYSPALMQSALDRIRRLERIGSSGGSLFGTELDSSEILDEDLTGEAPENYIRYERHEVNTNSSINLLQPSRGPFYKEGVAVYASVEHNVTLNSAFIEANFEAGHRYLFSYSDATIVASNASHLSKMRRVIFNSVQEALTAIGDASITGILIDLDNDLTELVNGTDYTLTNVDLARTAASVNRSGVYAALKFITARVGVVYVSYHAFGGVATSEDVRSLKQEITNTKSVVMGSDIVTGSTIKDQDYIRGLNKRLSKIETYHNFNAQIEHNISTHVPGFHWLNIAYIYPGEDNYDLITDIGQFRITSALRKWSYEFVVDLDMTRTEQTDVILLKTLGTNQRAGGDVTSLGKMLDRDIIAVRLCWVDTNGDAGKTSGLVLQIGWDFDAYQTSNYPVDNDTIVVTNKSGSTSNWKLCMDPTQVGFAADGLITVYYHNKYKVTGDATVIAGKKYYEYINRYKYEPTYDVLFRSDKTYYWLNGSSYSVIDHSSDPNKSIADWRSANDNKVVYEHCLIGKFISVKTLAAGSVVPSGTLELSNETYNQDEHITMPNEAITWSKNGSNCEAAVKLLEPDDGIIVWNGNLSLSLITPKQPSTCGTCTGGTNDNPAQGSSLGLYTTLNDYIQNIIDPRAITAATMVLFDRVRNRFTTVHIPLERDNRPDDTINRLKYTVVGDALFCPEDLCFLHMSILQKTADTQHAIRYVVSPDGTVSRNVTRISGGDLIRITLEEVFMGSFSNKTERFDLRQIRFHM